MKTLVRLIGGPAHAELWEYPDSPLEIVVLESRRPLPVRRHAYRKAGAPDPETGVQEYWHLG